MINLIQLLLRGDSIRGLVCCHLRGFTGVCGFLIFRMPWLGIHVGGPLCFSSCILQRRLSTQLAVGTYFAYIAAYDILSPDRYQIRNHLRTAYILFGYLHPQTSLSTPIPQDLLLFVYSRLVPKLGIRLNPKAISLLSTQNWQAWSHNLSHPTLKLASTQAKNLPVISNFDKKTNPI